MMRQPTQSKCSNPNRAGVSWVAALLVTATAAVMAVGSTGKAFDYTIDFESVTGLSPSPNYLGGSQVPVNAQLSDQLRAEFGVRFASANKSYVGLLDIGVGHAASGRVSIAAVNSQDNVNYSEPFFVSFVDPADESLARVTNSVSLRADNDTTSSLPIRIEAFDQDGDLLGFINKPENPVGVFEIRDPFIHSIKVVGNGSVAFDDLAYNQLVEAPTTIRVNSGVQTQTEVGFPAFDLGSSVAKKGVGTLILDSPNGSPAVFGLSEGTVILSDSSALFRSQVVVRDGGVLSLSPGVVARFDTLSVARGGLVDVGKSSITVASGLTPEQTTAGLLRSRGDGTWNGTSGITSTAAAADLQNGIVRSVGWKINPDDSITVAYAAPGDTNLDGEVNVFDLVNVNGSGTYGRGNPSNWSQGDFDYNGVTNIFDMVQTNGAGVYGRGNYLPATPPSVNAVPEPTSLLLAFTGLASGYYMLRRRGA